MMNVPPSEAAKLSLHDYEAMLWNWNEAHRGKDDIEPPDPVLTMERLAKINADRRLTH
jgi:hypothetical protein